MNEPEQPGWLRERFADSDALLPPVGSPQVDELRRRARRRRSRRRAGSAALGTAGVAALVTAVLVLGAGPGPSKVDVASPPSRRSPTTSAPSLSAPTTSAPTSAATAPPACRPGQLSVRERRYPQPTGGYVISGLGNSAVVVLFENDSSGTCDLSGYPAVSGVGSSGAAVGKATPSPGGYLGGLPVGDTKLPVVRLRPGASASAMVEGTDNPQGSATSCPTLSGLEVTPPGGGVPVRLPAAPGDCNGLEVHPVVPGDTGTDRG